MTKEELKEAIAATITENGNKGITGQALANLLNEIVDAAGEGGGGNAGGGGTLTIAVTQDITTGAIVSVSKEKNAQIFKTLAEGLNNCIAYSVSIFMTVDLTQAGLGVIKTITAIAIYGITSLDTGEVITLQSVDGAALLLYPDGTIIDNTTEE